MSLPSLLEKIRNNIIRRVSAPFVTQITRLRAAGLVSVLLRLHLKRIQNNGKIKDGSRCIHILILPKAGFTQDALSAFGDAERYALYALDRWLVKAVFKGFLPVEVDDNNYRSSTDPFIQKGKRELRSFWGLIFNALFDKIKIDVVLSGNFSYASEQEFAGALQQMGIPFIAMHKECLKTPGLEPFYEEIYKTRKNPFQGSKICVYNEIESRIEKAARVTAPENIIVTGMPRLDCLHQLRQKASPAEPILNKKPIVLFFSFNTKAGLPIIGRKLPQRFENLGSELERLNCRDLSRSCHLAMLKLAKENPDIKVVIKTKGDQQSSITLNRFFGKDLVFPKNLKIMAGGDLIEVLEKSTAVCGFNTTALLEAIALNKTVVVPRYHEALSPQIEAYILNLDDAVQYAASEEQLVEMLKEAANFSESPNRSFQLEKSKQRLLNKWLGNPDGLAGQRVRAVVEKTLQEKKKC